MLDDEPARIIELKKRHPTETIIVAYSYDDGIDKLKSAGDLDILYLDHDLNSGPGKHGSAFAQFIVNHFKSKKPFCIIHSMNPVGANNMKNILTQAGFQVSVNPFHTLIAVQ